MAAKKVGAAKKGSKATSAKTNKSTAKKTSKQIANAKSNAAKKVREEKTKADAKAVKTSIATQGKQTKVTQKKTPEKLSDIYTQSGVRLTVKEAKFIDEYIATGNIRQSVINAGYAGLPNVIGNQLIKKLYIAEEIQRRMTQHEQKSIADREEIMQFWTDMMRGKILDQFDMPTTNADKLKAAAELAKRGMDIEDRIKERNSTTAPEIKISLDWGGHTNGTEE